MKYSCRVCASEGHMVHDYGPMPLANAFSQDGDKNEPCFNMSVMFCDRCKMFQLTEQPNPEDMFHENYAFFSSTSKYMAKHFQKMAEHYMNEYLPAKDESFVVELGSNDGIMLRHIAAAGISHLGVEPSANVAEVARGNGVNTVSKFFGKETAAEILDEYGPADVISSANVMCHIPDLNSVGEGVALLLKDTGVFVFEDPYLGDVVQKTSYDQIYDEHVYLFSALSVSNAFAKHGLELFDVAPQRTHGGSMRYYLCKRGARPVRESVQNQIAYEQSLGLETISGYEAFSENCAKSKADLVAILKDLKSQGKRVVGYAATSKSTTILNYCGIGPDLIEYICDTTPLKHNTLSPGMHIPVKPYEQFQTDNPDYAVLFAWNHAREIFEKESDFLANGGKWIVFVPSVAVLETQDDLKKLVA